MREGALDSVDGNKEVLDPVARLILGWKYRAS